MPARTRKDLVQSLKQGQIEPVYFLYGSESYLRDQASREIAETALRGTLLREFNDSSNSTFSAAMSAMQSPRPSSSR
jgi:DNA polymerase III delta subunit